MHQCDPDWGTLFQCIIHTNNTELLTTANNDLQLAQLLQSDSDAGWVSFSQKW